jgi:hypothetical protein
MAIFGHLLFAVMLVACASSPVVEVPDTKPGEQIQDEYLVGKWCTNRAQTAISNQAAGFSGLLNVRPVFWRFGADGEWDISTSGFLFESYGGWHVFGLDTLQLAKKEMEPKTFRARFKNEEGVANLYLIDDKGQFTVLSRCD